MADKGPEDVRIVLTMPRKLVDRIDDYRFSLRLLSRAAAIRALAEDALKRHERPPRQPKPPNESG